MREATLIELLKQNDSKAFRHIYTYFKPIKSMIKNRGGNEEQAKDIFQEAVIIIYKKLQDDTFQLTVPLSAYLYSVSYKMWLYELRKSGKEITSTDFNNLQDEGIDDAIEHENKLRKVEGILKQLGEKCLRLLQLYYYQKKTMKAISQDLGYSSESSAKNQKYKCLERARKMAVA